nr:MAG TPA: SERCA1a [Bacteriophage sp.]
MYVLTFYLYRYFCSTIRLCIKLTSRLYKVLIIYKVVVSYRYLLTSYRYI